jgi:hypothetical protein
MRLLTSPDRFERKENHNVKKFTKKQIEEQAAIGGELRSAYEDYENALSALNDAIQKAEDFKAEVVGAMDEYLSERSEKWTESEAGQAYSEWKDAWESFELEQAEPVEVDFDAFEELAPEPGF